MLIDLIGAIALHAVQIADSPWSSLLYLYAGGMPDGLGPGGLAAGAAAAAAAAGAGAAAYGPHLPSVSAAHRALGYAHYRDSAGNPYWPGISAIPEDGIVYPPANDIDRRRAGDFSNSPTRGDDGMMSPNPLPIGPRGMPIHPPSPDLERATAAQTAGGRG